MNHYCLFIILIIFSSTSGCLFLQAEHDKGVGCEGRRENDSVLVRAVNLIKQDSIYCVFFFRSGLEGRAREFPDIVEVWSDFLYYAGEVKDILSECEGETFFRLVEINENGVVLNEKHIYISDDELLGVIMYNHRQNEIFISFGVFTTFDLFHQVLRIWGE